MEVMKMQNPIGEADSHGFCISNCEGTEQLRLVVSDTE